MKSPRKIFSLFAALALIALLAWKFWPTENPQPVAPAPKLTPLQTVVGPKPAQVEAPKVAPVTASVLTTASGAKTSTPTNLELSADDPHASPQTLIPELINLLEDDDFTGYLKANLPPSALEAAMREADVSSIEELAQKNFPTSGSLAKLTDQYKLNTLETLQLIQNQAPVLDTENEITKAIYTLNPPINGKKTVTFMKIGGLWYLIGN